MSQACPHCGRDRHACRLFNTHGTVGAKRYRVAEPMPEVFTCAGHPPRPDEEIVVIVGSDGRAYNAPTVALGPLIAPLIGGDPDAINAAIRLSPEGSSLQLWPIIQAHYETPQELEFFMSAGAARLFDMSLRPRLIRLLKRALVRAGKPLP